MDTNRGFQVLVSVVALVALAACGGDGGAARAGGGAGTGASASVTIADNEYDPGDVRVGPGGSVSWSNADSVPHTITFEGDRVESSEELRTGEEFSATFPSVGEYPYVCSIHPDMTGTVTVS